MCISATASKATHHYFLFSFHKFNFYLLLSVVSFCTFGSAVFLLDVFAFSFATADFFRVRCLLLRQVSRLLFYILDLLVEPVFVFFHSSGFGCGPGIKYESPEPVTAPGFRSAIPMVLAHEVVHIKSSRNHSLVLILILLIIISSSHDRCYTVLLMLSFVCKCRLFIFPFCKNQEIFYNLLKINKLFCNALE